MTLQRKKEIGIVSFVGLYTVLFFLLVAVLINDHQQWVSLTGMLVGLAGLGWVALMGTAMAFLFQRPNINIVLIAIPCVAVIFIGLFSLESLIGAALLAVFLLVAKRALTRDIESRVQFRVNSVFYWPTKIIIVGLIVSVITLTLPELRARLTAGELSLPLKTVEAVIEPVTPLISRLIPDYHAAATVDDIINAQLARQSGSVAPPPNLSQEQREVLRAQLAQQLGVELSGNETLARLLAVQANQYVQQLANQPGLVVLALLVAAFLALRAIVPPLAWLVLSIAALLVYVSERVGLISLLKTQVTVERLSL